MPAAGSARSCDPLGRDAAAQLVDQAGDRPLFRSMTVANSLR